MGRREIIPLRRGDILGTAETRVLSCAELFGPNLIGHVTGKHTKVTAYSLMGQSEKYADIPCFWCNQGDIKLHIAGLSTGYDQTVVRHDTD